MENLPDEEFETMTVLFLRTGQVVEMEKSEALKEIRFGAAVETAPKETEAGAAWRAKMSQQLREKVEERFNGHVGRRPDVYRECLDTMHDFEAFWAERGRGAFPTDEGAIVSYLLAKVAEGSLDKPDVPRRVAVLGELQEMTKHPPRHLWKTARDAYVRAVAFATRVLRDELRTVYLEDVRVHARALEMFPDGVVPRHFHEIAA